MTFKYFDRPETLTGFIDEKTSCSICGAIKLCFDAGSFYGHDEITSICPECLSSGKLFEIDTNTCNGDIDELLRQLKELNPDATEYEIREIANKKTNELEKTTPPLISWQDWSWPCLDGDYCKFIGYGSKPFYNSLSAELTGEELFKNSFYYNLKDESDVDFLWKEILPETEVVDYKDSNVLSTIFYVFKSLNSDRIITIWDTD